MHFYAMIRLVNIGTYINNIGTLVPIIFMYLSSDNVKLSIPINSYYLIILNTHRP